MKNNRVLSKHPYSKIPTSLNLYDKPLSAYQPCYSSHLNTIISIVEAFVPSCIIPTSRSAFKSPSVATCRTYIPRSHIVHISVLVWVAISAQEQVLVVTKAEHWHPGTTRMGESYSSLTAHQETTHVVQRAAVLSFKK